MNVSTGTQPHFRKRYKCVAGQAMVEFTILLFVIMIMCAGMLYSHRLLGFDFWAMQEARFMAFSKTWVQTDGGVDYEAVLSDDEEMRRPRVISSVLPTRDELPSEEVGALLAMNSIPNGSSIWKQKTSDWLNYYNDQVSMVSTALAASFGGSMEVGDELSEENGCPYVYQSEYEHGIIALLQDDQFGMKFCAAMRGVLSRYGIDPKWTEFGLQQGVESKCASNYDHAFGLYLAKHVNLRAMFEAYSWRLGEEEAGVALGNVIKQEVGNQFYSFFDDEVKESFSSSLDYLSIERHEIFSQLTAAYFDSLIKEARYVGATNALLMVQDHINKLKDTAYKNRSSASALLRDRSFSSVLHANLAPTFSGGWRCRWCGGWHGGWNEFYLTDDFHPFPENLGFAFDDLFDGVMENVLYNEGDSERELLLEESNVSVEVEYPAEHGLFSAATKRFDVAGKNPSARFYLITQPWHIARVSYDGAGADYFPKGTSSDPMGARTDEGLLRERIYGLWLMPRRPDAMIVPLAEVAAGSISYDAGQIISGLSDVLDFIGVADTPDAVSKPFEILVSATQEISELFGFDFSPPVWPVVRPDAYPGSTEMVNDNLTGPGSNRTFMDYVNEQNRNRHRTP